MKRAYSPRDHDLPRRSIGAAVALLSAGLCLSGCGAGQSLTSVLQQGSVAQQPTGSIAGADTTKFAAASGGPTGVTDGIEVVGGAGSVSVIVSGGRVAIYERLARTALSCWLGPAGPLKGRYVFGAEVPPEPDANSAKSAGITELGIYVRDPAQPAARGFKAFRISLESHGDSQTRIDAANSRINPVIAAAMGRDVEAWARGTDSCVAQTVMPPPPPEPVAAVASPKPTLAKKAKKPTP